MFKRINELKAKKGRGEQGFTLIELLIVVAIIGILAAIAIPQFAAYRMRGFNASAQSDTRNTRTGEEALFADFQLYGSSDNSGTLPGPGTLGAGALLIGALAPATATTVAGPGCCAALSTTTPGGAVGIGMGVGNLVAMQASVDVAGASYMIGARHQNGNTAYAADADSTALFFVQNLAWVGVPGAISATVPGPTAGTADIVSTVTAGGGAPIAAWTAQ